MTAQRHGPGLEATAETLVRGIEIPLSVPHLGGREEEYLRSCVTDNWVSSVGPYVAQFEERFATRLGARHAVACASGTAALQLALEVAGVGSGDLVLLSDLTFIASANAVLYRGASPVLVDCDPESWQLDVKLVEKFLRDECRVTGGYCKHVESGRRIGAIMPVHILGHSVDMAALGPLAEVFSIPLVEDAAEALGVSLHGRSVGRFGIAGCFSFNGNKIITSGAGGMIVTDDDEIATRLKHLSQQAKVPGVEFIHDALGYNYRMSNLHAAIGLAQLERLEKHIERKREIADRYLEAFSSTPGVSWPKQIDGSAITWWLPTLAIDPARCDIGSRQLIDLLRDRGIEARPLWQPMHLSLVHAGHRCLGGAVSQKLYETSISLPCSVGLTDQEQDRVIGAVLDALDKGR